MVHVSRRGFLNNVAVTGVALSLAGGARAFARQPTLPDDATILRYVNPELREAAKPSIKWARTAPPMSQNYLVARKQMGNFTPPLADVPVREEQVKAPGGLPGVPVYVINAGSGRRPAIVHIHGGGMIMGSAKAEIHDMQVLAKTLDCVIVSVDYALSPDVTYKVSTEQNYAALKWLHDHADTLGVDRARIAVMGESAGGGLSAILAIMARDRGEVSLALQCLIYPMLDDRTGSAHVPPFPIGAFSWTAPDNVFGWQSFLGQKPGTAKVPVAAVPARTENLAGLAPAFIGVGSIDLFVDEDVTYAHRLIDAGVMTELQVVPGAFHGFDFAAPDSGIARQFTRDKLNALRRAFGQVEA